jgi:hypothetical protein
VDELRERRLPTALGSIDLAFAIMAWPRFLPAAAPGWFPSAPPVATPLPRNVAAAKDLLNPYCLRVTPLGPRDTSLGKDDTTIRNYSLNQCIITRFYLITLFLSQSPPDNCGPPQFNDRRSSGPRNVVILQQRDIMATRFILFFITHGA